MFYFNKLNLLFSFWNVCLLFEIHSPRDSTGGLGVKMVEYVLGGSPTNKESPLSNMESRLRGLKFDESDKVSQTPFRFNIISNTI